MISDWFREIRTVATVVFQGRWVCLRSWKLSGLNLSHQDVTDGQKSAIFRVMTYGWKFCRYLFSFHIFGFSLYRAEL